jgi:hypothetical protein
MSARHSRSALPSFDQRTALPPATGLLSFLILHHLGKLIAGVCLSFLLFPGVLDLRTIRLAPSPRAVRPDTPDKQARSESTALIMPGWAKEPIAVLPHNSVSSPSPLAPTASALAARFPLDAGVASFAGGDLLACFFFPAAAQHCALPNRNSYSSCRSR